MIDKAYVYIVKCSDGTLYTGWTRHIKTRIEKHNSGVGAKYTRGRLPVTLLYFEEMESKSAALCREAAIKKLSKSKKLALVESVNEEKER